MSLVTIRAEEYEKVGQETAKGYSIELAPYDIPREVEGKLDKEMGVLHIDFKYVDKEDFVPKQLNERLTVKVGKYSGKILGFDVAVKKYDIQEVALILTQAVDDEIPKLTKYNQRANYKVIRSVLDRNRMPILSDLGPQFA